MSLFVHCGHEFFPRWWYRFPATGWLLTPLFHDQHHSLVGCNYGGFTTIWDRLFGTVSPRYARDFEGREWRTLAASRSAV
jgi:sterol desaturase/sphingolipid hydroxylase (fatty acid hydroxylase superfamily)